MRILIALILAVPLFGQDYKPLGRMIDIGGRKLHLYCTGSGSPTILLMPGGDAYSIDWSLVQASVSGKTRVCSYDRAGLGWSDPGPADETVEQTVADLHAILRAAQEKPPYVLAGASIGGIFIRAYQYAYRDEVAGLVFSNSSNRVGLKVKEKVGLLWELPEEEIRSAYPLPATGRGPAPKKNEDPFDRLPADLQAIRLWFDTKNWERWDPAKATPDQNLSWRKEFLREFEETEPGRPRPLESLPVLVVSGSPAASESDRKSRAGAAARLDFLSSNDSHITVADTGHEIHLYKPQAVIDALGRMISAVRSGAPLSGAVR